MAIPASTIVSVNSSVLAPGGTGLVFAGMFLTQNSALPSGAPTSFVNETAVGDYFGTSSTEYALSKVYFQGFDTSTIKPGLLWFSRYSFLATAAFLRGGPVTSLAAINAIEPAVVTGSIATTVLTVTAVGSGALAAGMVLSGAGVTADTRIVQQLTGVAGGIGTYRVDTSQTVASESIDADYDLSIDIDGSTVSAASLDLSGDASFSAAAATIASSLGLSGGQTCVYSSQYNAFVITSGTTGATSTIAYPVGAGAADALGLSAAEGGVLSQGKDAITDPGAYMDAVVAYTQNWGTFMTVWEPDLASKKSFAQWASASNTRYMYVASDSDPTIVQTPSAFTGFAKWLADNDESGTAPEYDSFETCAMICGITAATDFTQLNGRVNYMFRTNSQIGAAVVTDLTEYENMIANGYSSYCAFGVEQQPNMLANGQISGPFKWIDSYVGAMRLNVNMTAAMVNLLQQTKSLPYNQQGAALIAAAAADPINEAINFGTIRPNVKPSASEAAQMNAAAGQQIDGVVGTRGWYFQVGAADANTRAARQSPPISLWYMDGQSVQQITISSVDVL
jgi:hypothetical protein